MSNEPEAEVHLLKVLKGKGKYGEGGAGGRMGGEGRRNQMKRHGGRKEEGYRVRVYEGAMCADGGGRGG